MRARYFFWFMLATGLVSCIKDKPPVVNTVVLPGEGKSEGVLIVNEGAFNFGNAGISYYRFSDGAVSEDLFKPANNRKLGDVCQSLCRFNNQLFLVVNNSEKVEVVDPGTFVSKAQIKGLLSPRYFLGVGINKAYVSDFKSNQIAVVDLNSFTKTKAIQCPGWTEEMTLAFGKAYVTNLRSSYLYVIQTATDQITDSILVGYGNSSIVQDKFGKLWVSTGGNADTGEKPALVVVNPNTDQVEKRLEFLSGSPSQLCFNATSDTLFYLNTDVWKMSVGTNELPQTPVIRADGRNVYGFGVDPGSGDIYLADALDYVQRGTVYRHSGQGTLITSFKVGYIPSRFYFN